MSGRPTPSPIFLIFKEPAGLDSKESIPPDPKSIPGLLKMFTNMGSGAQRRN